MVCKNCKETFDDTKNYCPECGAKVIRNRLTLKALSAQFSEEFLSYDNKIFQTFIDLFKKPEVVIDTYVSGTRKKYIGVAQFFAIALTFVGLQVFLMTNFFEDLMTFEVPFMDNYDSMTKKQQEIFDNANKEMKSFNNFQSVFFVIAVPFSALSTWLSFIILGDRRYNFTEHLILNLYYSSQTIIVNVIIIIISFLLGINYFTISLYLLIFNFIYLFWVLYRIFKTSFLNTFAKFLLVTIFIFISYIFLMLFSAVAGVVFTFLSKSKI